MASVQEAIENALEFIEGQHGHKDGAVYEDLAETLEVIRERQPKLLACDPALPLAVTHPQTQGWTSVETSTEDTPVAQVVAANLGYDAAAEAAEREFQRMNRMQKVKDAIEVITSELNGGNRKDVGAAIYGAIATTHRTLQQDFWSALLYAQILYAENPSDLRNAEAVAVAKAVKALAEKNNWDLGLPRI